MLQRLLGRLNRIFNRDPEGVPALTVLANPASATVTVQVNGVTITAPGLQKTIMDGSSITALAAALTSTYGATVDTIPTALAGKDANWLVEGIYDGPAFTIPFPTALLYTEFQLYARTLAAQGEHLQQACKQVYPNTADGEWLDIWFRDYFGISRYVGETDAEYLQRTPNEILRPSQNNKALEAIVLAAMGIKCQILDAQAVNNIPDNAGRFLLDISLDNGLTPEEAQILLDRVEDVVRRYKSAGTDFAVSQTKLNAPSELIAVVEALALQVVASFSEPAYSPGYIQVGAGWRVGTPGLKVGLNDGLKEQIFIQKIQIAGGTVVQTVLHGG